jgi:hypothetical protein
MLAAQFAVYPTVGEAAADAFAGHWWRADWSRLAELFRLGLPIGLILTFEAGVFAAAIYLMGLIDTVSVASHVIALQIAALAFMVPLGLAQAADGAGSAMVMAQATRSGSHGRAGGDWLRPGLRRCIGRGHVAVPRELASLVPRSLSAPTVRRCWISRCNSC